jgi:uncharacterized membrane protein
MSNKQPEKPLITEYLSYGRENLIMIYILFFASLLFPPFYFIGGLLVFLKIRENEKYDFLGSHYSFLFQTFWKGIIAYILCMFLVLFAIGIFLLPLLTIFLFVRLAFGLKFFLNNQTHPNPDTNWVK